MLHDITAYDVDLNQLIGDTFKRVQFNNLDLKKGGGAQVVMNQIQTIDK
jgi:hypothetical protein